MYRRVNVETFASLLPTTMVEYLFPGQRYFVYFGAFYASLLVFLSIPYFQGQ